MHTKSITELFVGIIIAEDILRTYAEKFHPSIKDLLIYAQNPLLDYYYCFIVYISATADNPIWEVLRPVQELCIWNAYIPACTARPRSFSPFR